MGVTDLRNQMKAPLASLVALLATSAAAPSQDPAAVSPEVQAAWAGFQKEHGSTWRVDWNRATGTPEAIWGPGLRLQDAPIATVAEARGYAQRVLKRFATLLGTGDSNCVEVIGEKVERVYIFVYRQRFKGLEVIDGRADIRIHDNGVLSLFGSQAFRIPVGLELVPKLDRSQARARAWKQLSLPDGPSIAGTKPQDRLVVWANVRQNSSPVRLAWEIDVNLPALKKVGRAYVDAQNGKLLQYRTNVFGCCGKICRTRPQPSESRAEVGMKVRMKLLAVVPDPNPHANPQADPVNPQADPANPQADPANPQANRLAVSGTVMAWTNTSLDPAGALKNVPVQNLAEGSTFTYANGKLTLPGTSATVTFQFRGRYNGAITAYRGTTFSRKVTLTGTNNTIQIFTSKAVEYDRSQSTCYYWLNRCMVFTRSILGNRTQLAKLSALPARVNLPNQCTGLYIGGLTSYTSDGNRCPNMAYATIVQHEWAHGLDDAFNRASLGEMSHGYADTVPILDNDDPIVGHKYYKTRTPNYLRTAVNSKTWRSGGFSSSDVWIGWLWDVRGHFVGRMGKIAGLRQLRKLFLGVFVPSPVTQRAAAREVALLDDNDGNLNNGTPNCIGLVLGLRKRQIPNPISGCPGIASYTTSGIGCKGTGLRDPNCQVYNTPCGRGTVGTSQDNLAFECIAPAHGAQILGVDMLTRGLRGPVTGRIELRLADPKGQPLNTTIRSATASLTTAIKHYRFTFSKPYTVPPGKKYFIFYPGTTATVVPYCYSPRNPVPYWKQAVNSSTWTRGDPMLPWSFVVRCQGGAGAVPTLSNTGTPTVGGSFSLNLTGAKANAAAFLLVGLSDKAWNALRLPYDLNPLGATGCVLASSGEVLFGVVADSKGAASRPFSVPNDLKLVGARFFNQFFVFDAKANLFGATVSNKGLGLVGR